MSEPSFISRDSIRVPKRLLNNLPSRLSFDNGATLSKILYVTEDEADADHCDINFLTVHKAEFAAAIRWIKTQQPAACGAEKSDEGACTEVVVKMTGVNFAHQELLKETFNASCEHVIELLTQVRGCHWMVTNLTEEQVFLQAEEPDPLYKMDLKNELLANIASKFKLEDTGATQKFPAILVCLGSGSMISVLDSEGKMSSFHFSMFSGKAMHGLAQLLLGTASYDEIMSMAERGDRAKVDLLVKEVIANDPTSPYGQFNGDIPMMHFGKAAEGRIAEGSACKDDVARSLVSLFCANLLGTVISISTLTKVPTVYFGGNFFRHRLARREFENAKSLLMQQGGFQHRFLRNGGHLGAAGALVATNMDAPVYLKFA